MARRRGTNRFASQAALEALVRFGPELSGLKELQRSAQSNFLTAVNQARGSANSIVGTIDSAMPQVSKIYDDAGLKQAAVAGTLMHKDVAGLSGVADSIKAGASLEAAGAANRLNESRSSALTDLSQQKVRARQGEQFAIGNARDQFVSAVEKILNRKQDLRREQGAFKAATINDLAEAEANRVLKRQEGAANRENARDIAGVDENGQIVKGGPKDPKVKKDAEGKKVNTDLQHGELDDKVGSARRQVEGLKAGRNRKQIMDILVNGRPAQTVEVDGAEVKLPGIDKRSPLVARAAIELYFDKKISRKTLKKLHARGFSVKKLGWRYASGKPSPSERLTNKALTEVRGIAEALGQIGE
jgi:hypothetical protein